MLEIDVVGMLRDQGIRRVPNVGEQFSNDGLLSVGMKQVLSFYLLISTNYVRSRDYEIIFLN